MYSHLLAALCMLSLGEGQSAQEKPVPTPAETTQEQGPDANSSNILYIEIYLHVFSMVTRRTGHKMKTGIQQALEH